MEPKAVVKILRRRGAPVDVSQDAVIQKNLQPLKENIQKKQRAQEAYYQHNNTMGTSPLTRDRNRKPVQQRLGRKVPFNGTNTSMVPPKKRLYKNSTLNNYINKRKTLKRNNYAQMRLNTIRERHRQSVLENNNPNIATKRLKLRRIVPTVATQNLQVQVRNNGAYLSNHLHGIKRHRIQLDEDIQLSINQLREMYSGEKISIFKVTPKATTIYLNDRFSSLS